MGTVVCLHSSVVQRVGLSNLTTGGGTKQLYHSFVMLRNNILPFSSCKLLPNFARQPNKRCYAQQDMVWPVLAELRMKNIEKRMARKGLPLYKYGVTELGRNRPKTKRKYIPIFQGDVIFGLHPCYFALKAGRRIPFQLLVHMPLIKPEDQHTCSMGLVDDIQELAKQKGIPVYPAKINLLDMMAENKLHQGVILDASTLTLEPFDVSTTSELKSNSSDSPRIWIIIDSIKDPSNYGAILRSAYYLGVDRVFSVENKSTRLCPDVGKSSAGVVDILPVFNITDLPEFLKIAKNNGWQIIGRVGMERSVGAIPVEELQLTQDTILVLGDDEEGVSDDHLPLCSVATCVEPSSKAMFTTGVYSLNVALATGIMLENLRRSRSH